MRKSVTKLFFYIIVFTFSAVIFPLYAVDDFKTDYDIEYSINTFGTTIVTQRIVMTNVAPNVFPKQYSVVIDTDKIKNVIAFDDGGPIKLETSVQDGKTTIVLPFNLQTVGLGKKTNFSIRFEDGNIAQKVGNIWEIAIPGITNTKDVGQYSVTLTVPETFGNPSYMTPLPKNGRKWTKEQLVEGGISIAYGTDQYYSTNLKYILVNDQPDRKRTEIALPPDSAFQKVTIKSLNPQPVEVVTDTDGNWMARYDIAGKSTLTIDAELLISITLYPRKEWQTQQSDISEYIKPTRYWNSKDPRILALAQEYTSAQDIYHYVVKTLMYDVNRLLPNTQRKGAVEALITPKESVCMEFTDLFIAIARAAGIPARQAVGYAHTTNPRLRPLSLVTDVLHAWPEYWDKDKNLWIPVDPTWGNTTGGLDYFTKLDFNHIVFAYNGLRDEYPYPAGTYRKNDDTSKYVLVDFTDESIYKHFDPSFSISFDFPKNILSGIPAHGTFILQNTGKSSVDNINISIESNPEAVHFEKSLNHLPPYTTYKIPIMFRSSSFTQYGSGQLLATVNNERLTHTFYLQPVHAYLIVSILLLLFAVAGVSIYMRRKK